MRIEMENLKNTMKLSEIKHVIQRMNKTNIGRDCQQTIPEKEGLVRLKI